MMGLEIPQNRGASFPHLSLGLTQESEIGKVLDSRVSKNYY